MSDRTHFQRASTIILTLVAIAVVGMIAFLSLVAIGLGSPSRWSLTEPERRPPSATVPIEENVFYPQERTLSDCTGFVERPGCGSEARGGTAQTVLAAVLFGALGFIGWRVYRGVRRRPA